MALSDWLNPAPAAPTYLTSRAQGVVVPQYYQGALTLKQNALDLAGKEQSLYSREDDIRRQREEEDRQKTIDAAGKAVLPQLGALDVNSPSYYSDLSKLMQQPDAANALMNKSVGQFLDLTGRGRSDTQAVEERARSEARYQEGLKLDKERELRQTAREDANSVDRLAASYADKLGGDVGFAASFKDLWNKAKTPEEKTKVVDEQNYQYYQKKLSNDLLDEGVDPVEIESLKETVKVGDKEVRMLGDKARVQLAQRKRSITPQAIFRAKVDAYDKRIAAESSPRTKEQVRAEKDAYVASVDPNISGGVDSKAEALIKEATSGGGSNSKTPAPGAKGASKF